VNQYGFSHEWEKERERLRNFQELLDPGTIRHLEKIGVASGWRCLEIGGGAGSITRWLCEKVGSNGHVTATDLEVFFLNELSYPNLSVLKHDIVSDDLPTNAFDLIHERSVLEHLPSRDEVLQKLVKALKPGGWLLVEDVDHHLILHTDEPKSPFRDAMKIIVKTLSDQSGFDPYCGRKHYTNLISCGLLEVSSEGRIFQQPSGNSGISRIWQLILERLREEVLNAGLTVDQFEEAIKGFERSEYGAMSPIWWAAWGKRG
jgi:SAM-dependent methyltransferase